MSVMEIEEMGTDSPLERQYTTLEAKNWLDHQIQTSEMPTPVPMVPQLPAVLWACFLPLSFPQTFSGCLSCCCFAFSAFLGLYQQMDFKMTSLIFVKGSEIAVLFRRVNKEGNKGLLALEAPVLLRIELLASRWLSFPLLLSQLESLELPPVPCSRPCTLPSAPLGTAPLVGSLLRCC